MFPPFGVFKSFALDTCFCPPTADIVVSLFTGLESTNSENYKEAFTCFLAAAQQGYSKAQFNTGVCYEKGRGVVQDRDKVRVMSGSSV